MNNRFSSASEQQLADRLAREAEDLAPPFSDDLHGRIMRRLADPEATAADDRSPRPIRIFPHRLLRVAAMIAAVAGIWWALSPTEPAVEPMSFSLPTAPQVLTTTVGPVEQAMVELQEQRLAYLDEDAAALAEFVLSQLPLGEGNPSPNAEQ